MSGADSLLLRPDCCDVLLLLDLALPPESVVLALLPRLGRPRGESRVYTSRMVSSGGCV